MKVKDIVDIMDKLAPKELIEDWDNTGFQLGNPEREVEKILLALDITKETIDYAINEDIDMIITHHSLFFIPVKSIYSNTPKGKIIYKLVKNDIAVFSAHSNLDLSEDGVNEALSEKLELKDTEVLVDKGTYNVDGIIKNSGFGRIGHIKRKMELIDFLEYVKEKLDCETIRLYGDKKKLVKRVAVCGGSATDFIKDAHKHNADVYITGDIRSFDAQLAFDLGIPVIDANHYETERVVLPKIKEHIEKNTENIKVIISKERKDDNAPRTVI